MQMTINDMIHIHEMKAEAGRNFRNTGRMAVSYTTEEHAMLAEILKEYKLMKCSDRESNEHDDR